MATPHDEQRSFQFLGRERELQQINGFLAREGAGFTHLRGRRRIGKSELLRKTCREHDNCFYFMGRGDESNRNAVRRFARQWDAFTGERRLIRLKVSELNWDELFAEVGRHARAGDAPLILLLDEVQWLSKKGIGFCGLLKEHWAHWKKHSSVKLIIAGSSNRFFHEYTDGEMAILRGLRTHATIWVRPFSLAEVQRYYFPRWSREEVCLVYMMLGGVPYYLENIEAGDNFIRAVNGSVFCQNGIFLEEVDALLKLETSTVGARKRVKEVLASLGQDGATEAAVVKRTGLTQDYVHKTLGRLLDYDIVHPRRPLGQPKANRSGVRYYMDDFYLNFYFQVLSPLESRIRGNQRGLLFSAEVLGSGEGYYIPNFSGKAFELLLASVIREGCDDVTARTQPLFRKLSLGTGRYRWGTYWEAGKTQIDLLVDGLDDREVRVIEAKWVSRRVHAGSDFPRQVLGKMYEESWRHSNYLALSGGHTRGLAERAAQQDVGLIGLEDLF